MQLTLRHDLVFVTATLTYSGVSIEIANVLVDTGAASTVINADLAADAGVYVSPTDTLRRLRGVGGHEHVFTRRVDRLAIGDHGVDRFEVEVGEMDYGFEIGGILGMDFLRAACAIIDLGQLTLVAPTTSSITSWILENPILAHTAFAPAAISASLPSSRAETATSRI